MRQIVVRQERTLAHGPKADALLWKDWVIGSMRHPARCGLQVRLRLLVLRLLVAGAPQNAGRRQWPPASRSRSGGWRFTWQGFPLLSRRGLTLVANLEALDQLAHGVAEAAIL